MIFYKTIDIPKRFLLLYTLYLTNLMQLPRKEPGVYITPVIFFSPKK